MYYIGFNGELVSDNGNKMVQKCYKNDNRVCGIDCPAFAVKDNNLVLLCLDRGIQLSSNPICPDCQGRGFIRLLVGEKRCDCQK